MHSRSSHHRRQQRLALCALFLATSGILPAVSAQGEANSADPQIAAVDEVRQAASSEQAAVQLASAAAQGPGPGSVEEQQPAQSAQHGAGADDDAWWQRMARDSGNCSVEDAGKARTLSSAPSESGDACAAACR